MSSIVYSIIYIINQLPKAVDIEKPFIINFRYFFDIFVKLTDFDNMYNFGNNLLNKWIILY